MDLYIYIAAHLLIRVVSITLPYFLNCLFIYIYIYIYIYIERERERGGIMNLEQRFKTNTEKYSKTLCHKT